MSVNEFLEEMGKIQTNLLEYLDHGDNIEERFQKLINIFDDFKIHDNQFKIKPLLYLILHISNNHHRESEFFLKIEKILQLFKDDIKKYFSNKELFCIFKSNKRLLLYLLEENMMIIDEYIAKIFTKNDKYIKAKYPQYFQPEIQPFINKEWFPKYINETYPQHFQPGIQPFIIQKWLPKNKNGTFPQHFQPGIQPFINRKCFPKKKNKEDQNLQKNKWVDDLKKELPSDFYEKRKIGENDDEICKLIQKDLIDEFISYVNKNNYPINSAINPSIYETNNYLIRNNNIKLIDYAVFFGSIQIFNYLRKNGVKIYSTLWTYAVHGNNPEIIHFLEENKILPSKFEQIFYETIKCHHIDVANYIQTNYLEDKEEDKDKEEDEDEDKEEDEEDEEEENSIKSSINSLKYYNFMLLQCNIEIESLFYYLCKYDYYLLVSILLKNIKIDINETIIYIVICLILLNI